MPLSDAALSDLVTLFLVVFVLIGLHPALKRTASKLKRMLDDAADRQKLTPGITNLHMSIFNGSSSMRTMNDYEIFVMRRLAQARGKSLSRRQINETLLFGDAVLDKAMQSLMDRGMMRISISRFPGMRFGLTEAGRRYALEQGYIVELRQKEGRF